jgi:hypothetical protein
MYHVQKKKYGSLVYETLFNTLIGDAFIRIFIILIKIDMRDVLRCTQYNVKKIKLDNQSCIYFN